MSNRYVIAVDVGIKNLGLAIFDLQTKQLAVWGRYCICKSGPYQPGKNVEYVRQLIQEHATYFANAHKVLIEALSGTSDLLQAAPLFYSAPTLRTDPPQTWGAPTALSLSRT